MLVRAQQGQLVITQLITRLPFPHHVERMRVEQAGRQTECAQDSVPPSRHLMLDREAALVALPELLRSARVAQEQTYNPTPLTMSAVIFFVLLWPFARWVARLERS